MKKPSPTLSKVANLLERCVNKAVTAIAASIELFLIDLVFGKAKYRRRGPKMRPIIHRTYNRTIIIREPRERVYTVKSKEVK